jgi:Tfp pilus assembly protein PilF
MDKSVDLLQQAVARAPEYALAHAGLAEAHTRQAFLRASSRTEALGKARASANRALELDPDLAEAHTALALIRFFFEWDWAGADAEFHRALELNPGSSAVHEEYGGFLTAMGRLDEGLARSREALRLDPLSVGPVHDMAINAWVRGDYEQTAAGFRRTIEIDPNWTWGYVKLARILAVQKKCEEAFVQAEAAERKIAGGAAPLARSWLGATYAICGDTRRAREKLGELHALEKKQYVDPVTFATIHSALGEIDEAMRWYEKAFDDRTPNMVFAARAARFAPELVDKPRYMAIVERMGFPPPPR